MLLLDSNIIIYSYSNQYSYLRNLLVSDRAYVSEISRVEVLGYHKLTPDETDYFHDVFLLLPTLAPDSRIYDTAIEIRKEFNLKLADSLIAATAIEHKLSLYTRNLDDFKKVSRLHCINPIQ